MRTETVKLVSHKSMAAVRRRFPVGSMACEVRTGEMFKVVGYRDGSSGPILVYDEVTRSGRHADSCMPLRPVAV